MNLSRRSALRLGVHSTVALSMVPNAMMTRALANANSREVNLGFISCGGRARQLMSQFTKAGGARIAAVCDPDSTRIAQVQKTYPDAVGFDHPRKLLEQNVDAVVVATCNHWHCLAAIWAMEAGKHVYVEKPLSHSQWEGEQTVAAAKKYNRIAAIGTQQRSDPMQAQIKKFLHQEQGIGKLLATRVNRYGIRGAIGKREKPLKIEKDVNYDLWLGPAADKPIFRNNLHYDWHWDWNTGSGEMGNWGVHVLDDVRNNVFQDKAKLPKRIQGGGGRFVYNDAGETPNVHMAYFDTGSIPVVIGLSNLPAEPGSKKPAAHPGPGSGYVVYGEGGVLHGSRGRCTAYDNDGKKIAEFKGSGDVKHQANFLDAIRNDDPSQLNASIEVGNDSTGWCNLANIAFQVGDSGAFERFNEIDIEPWRELKDQTSSHLASHGLSFESSDFRFSEMMTLNEKTGQFDEPKANELLKREYRKGYEVPEIT